MDESTVSRLQATISPFQFQNFNIFTAHSCNLDTTILVSLSVSFLKLNDGVKQDGEDFSPLSDSISDTPRRSYKSPRIQLQLEGTRMDFYDQEMQQYGGTKASSWSNLETWIHL